MNITFLIGNGFDRNLGLKTSYSEFVEAYKKTDAKTETLKNFHAYISENEELWSAAEEEMGKYTAEFETGAGAAFYECHKDFCEKLAEYLKNEVKRINFQDFTQEIEKAFSKINALTKSFPPQERNVIEEIYKSRRNEDVVFNFIVYNYTDTLDQCVSVIKKKAEVLGRHSHGSITHPHAVGNVRHVHGTVTKKMVFGVNDKSQIAKPEIFDCEYGDIFEDLLIKRQANLAYQENTDSETKKIIDSSQIIYIYGMSIGVTDAIWWARICAWLQGQNSRHLIVQKYGMPDRGLLEGDYRIEERKIRQSITRFSNLPDAQKRDIENRIHITGENLFAELKDIAIETSIDEKSFEEILNPKDQGKAEHKEAPLISAEIDYIAAHNEELPTITVV